MGGIRRHGRLPPKPLLPQVKKDMYTSTDTLLPQEKKEMYTSTDILLPQVKKEMYTPSTSWQKFTT
jgi:hydroxyacyl-ACP dehydratase HTD2-like protein with hotdog domain